MAHTIHKILFAILIVTSAGSAALAQDYRILTEIKTTPPKGRPKITGRMLSIFHAGQTYDRVDGMDVVTIYQPALRQFTLFSAAHQQVTHISFKEISASLQKFDDSARDYIAHLKKKGDRASLRTIEALQFRLTPKFNERYDAKQGDLFMTSKRVSYTVHCSLMKGIDPEITSDYIQYADWMARLNSLMHAQAMFPEPRLKVNAALQARRVMPLKVEREDVPTGLRQSASHKIRWKLTKADKQSIFHWNQLLNDPDMVQVTFEKFRSAIAGK